MTPTDVLTTANLSDTPSRTGRTASNGDRDQEESSFWRNVRDSCLLPSFIKLFYWSFSKEIGRKWHAGRYIHRSYLSLCGKAKCNADHAGRGVFFCSHGLIYVPRLLLSRCIVGFGWTVPTAQLLCLRRNGIDLDSARLKMHFPTSWARERYAHDKTYICWGAPTKRHGFLDQDDALLQHSYFVHCLLCQFRQLVSFPSYFILWRGHRQRARSLELILLRIMQDKMWWQSIRVSMSVLRGT